MNFVKMLEKSGAFLAAAPLYVAVRPADAALLPEDEGKTNFDVVMTSFRRANKVSVIRLFLVGAAHRSLASKKPRTLSRLTFCN